MLVFSRLSHQLMFVCLTRRGIRLHILNLLCCLHAEKWGKWRHCFFFCGFRFKIFLELICIWMFLVFGLICSPPAFELILFCLQNWGLKLLETKERNVKKNQKKWGFKSKSGHEERERVKESLVFYRSFKSDSFSGRSLSWNGDIRRPRHLCVWPTYKTASLLLLLQSLSRPLLPLLHGITGGWAARCKK